MVMRLCTALLISSLAVVPVVAQSSGFPPLLADGPDPAYADKLATFGQFAGAWTFEGAAFNDHGTRTGTDKGEIHFHWILQGRAIQDVWIETERSDNSPKVLGTTVRFYDPKTDRWSITWIHPAYNTVRTLTGRRAGADIVIEGTSSTGTQLRWIFSDIKPDSFRWHAESLIGGKWRITEELHARRK
jgi:hypothetical protein